MWAARIQRKLGLTMVEEPEPMDQDQAGTFPADGDKLPSKTMKFKVDQVKKPSVLYFYKANKPKRVSLESEDYLLQPSMGKEKR